MLLKLLPKIPKHNNNCIISSIDSLIQSIIKIVNHRNIFDTNSNNNYQFIVLFRSNHVCVDDYEVDVEVHGSVADQKYMVR